MLKYKYNDGGRKAAGYKGRYVSDCSCRAIAIATNRPYEKVLEEMNYFAKLPKYSRLRSKNAEKGLSYKVLLDYMHYLGWDYIPSGCTNQLHLREGGLPNGRIVISMHRHLSAIIDGVVNDTWNCAKTGRRKVYGFWRKTTYPSYYENVASRF